MLARPVDRHDDARLQPPASRAAITASKASVSLRSSPNETTVAGPRRAMSRSAASRLPPASRGRMSTTGRPRYGLRPWSPRRSAPRGLDRSEDRGAAAGMSSAWRTWNATDGPLRSTNSHGGEPSDAATPAASASACGAWRRTPPRRDGDLAARRRAGAAVLEPVVAEIVDAADAGALGDVGDGPSGQDGDGEPVRPGRSDRGHPAQGPPGGGLDRRPRPGRASRGDSVPSKSAIDEGASGHRGRGRRDAAGESRRPASRGPSRRMATGVRGSRGAAERRPAAAGDADGAADGDAARASVADDEAAASATPGPDVGELARRRAARGTASGDAGRARRSPRGPATPTSDAGQEAGRSTAVTSWAGGYQYERSGACRRTPLLRCRSDGRLADRVRTRLIPALLTALGVDAPRRRAC